MTQITWTIFNGPSNKLWHNYKFKGPVFGCNFGYRDFPITDLYVADRICVHNVRTDPLYPGGINCYTKQSPLELPPGWRQQTMPGIDSGSFALEQAFVRHPKNKHVIIGADGILDGEKGSVYDYHFRGDVKPKPEIYKRYRKTVLELLDLYQPDYVFISEHKDPEIRTQTYNEYTS